MDTPRANLTNYHSHCDLCDGRAPMEEFVRAAIACGMTAYGVSSHAQSPVPGRTLRPETYDTYFARFAALRDRYRSEIELYVGLEVDYVDDLRNPASPYYHRFPTDYTIGSIHYIPTPCGTWMSVDGAHDGFRERLMQYFGGDIRQVVERFFAQSCRMVQTGGFTILGHPDKIALNARLFAPGITREPWYEQLAAHFLRMLAGRDFLVEVNTKAWDEHGLLFPAVEWWPLLRQMGVRPVVNSDCHYPQRINSGRMEALTLLREAGFTHVWELHNARWQPVEIAV